MYLAYTTLDIMFFVSMISRFMHCPSSHHLGAAKRILKHICGTRDLIIHYCKVQNFSPLDIKTLIGLNHVKIERALVDMCFIRVK